MTGSMSIAEKRLPQDGRIQVKMGKKADRSARLHHPDESRRTRRHAYSRQERRSRSVCRSSAFSPTTRRSSRSCIKLPDGILLVTGPTGSGKTTTLYGCLHYINKPDKKLITVEDPVEYQMAGINQVQVNADIGMTFPAALRSMLRQAPNIIMIGEIRDVETANIAINASLTGHLVFSTLHTNDAPERRRASRRYRRAALPRLLRRARDHRPAARAQALPELQAARRADRSRNAVRSGLDATQLDGAHGHERRRAATTASTSATKAGWASSRSS